MKPERLIPVTSESQLRIGMIVVIKNARRLISRRPLGTIRAMVLGCYRGDDGRLHWRWTYDYLNFSVHEAIPEGRLFRVDDGMDAEYRGAKSDLVVSR